MEIKKLSDLSANLKTILGFAAALVGATVGIIRWVEVQAEEQQLKAEVRQDLIHDTLFVENRIQRLTIQIAEHERELGLIQMILKGAEPAPWEQRRIDFLTAEIIALKKQIEDIRADQEKNLTHGDN